MCIKTVFTMFYNWGILITSVYYDLSIYLKRGLYHVTLFLVGDKLIKKKLSWHITWSSKIFTSFFRFTYFANNCKCISQFPFCLRLIMMEIMKLNKSKYPYILRKDNIDYDTICTFYFTSYLRLLAFKGKDCD